MHVSCMHTDADSDPLVCRNILLEAENGEKKQLFLLERHSENMDLV